MNLEPIVYERLEPVRVPVTIRGTAYELREGDESAAIVIKTAAMSGVEVVMEEDNGHRTIKHLSGAAIVNAVIVSQCLWERFISDKNEEGWRKVSELRVRAFPPQLVKQLAERANEISEFEKADDLPALKKQRAALDTRIRKLEADLPNAEPSGGVTSSPTAQS